MKRIGIRIGTDKELAQANLGRTHHGSTSIDLALIYKVMRKAQSKRGGTIHPLNTPTRNVLRYNTVAFKFRGAANLGNAPPEWI